MRIVKVVSLGLGAAFLSLTAASSAGPQQNLTSLDAKSPTTVTSHYLNFVVRGEGKCHVGVKYMDSTGKVIKDDPFIDNMLKTIPTNVHALVFSPGDYKIVTYTVADPAAPNCPGGQQVTSSFTAIPRPQCPYAWKEAELNPHTGAISCVPQEPVVMCAGKTHKFFTPTAQVCAVGCEIIPE